MTEKQLRKQHATDALHQALSALASGQYPQAYDRAEEALVILKQIRKDEQGREK